MYHQYFGLPRFVSIVIKATAHYFRVIQLLEVLLEPQYREQPSVAGIVAIAFWESKNWVILFVGSIVRTPI